MSKKYFILMMTVLLSLTASADKWQGTVDLRLTAPNGYTTNIVQAVAIFDNEAGTATLGNGYNACISQFEEGSLSIPATYNDYTNGTFRVEVGPMAFRFCNYLTKVEMEEGTTDGEGVTTIGTCAFVGCSRLHTLTLPSSLTTIGAGAFAELPSLKVVYCNAATAPTWEWNDVFATLGTKASMAAMAADRFLYVPAGALASYDSYQFDGTQTRANEKVGWPDAFARVYEVNDEPQPISSLDELVEFRNAVNEGGKYKGSNSAILTADIDMASITNWEPIGTTTEDSKKYTGTFNGGGHVIKNLSVDRPNDQYAGLFGYVYNATICNLHLVNPTVKGHNSAGTVVAYADKSHIADVLVDGASVQANGGDGGGIVGSLNVSTAERCLFSGEVKGEGTSNCGGIAGSFGYQSATIDCSASGSITNDRNTGGIVGIGNSGVTITRCMARNTFTGSGTKGAIIGHLYNSGGDSHITDCAYWNHQETLNMIGEQTSNDDTNTVTTEGNMAFYEESYILSDKARNQLGDGWHYFTSYLTGYPIPATLLDMYMNSMLSTDDNGLVYFPLGTPSDFNEYMVYGYKGTAESLTIPATHNGKAVVAINDDVFRGNTTIKTMNTGENMVLIGKGAFYGSAIQDLTLGNNLREIGESAFEECDALTAVALPTNFQKVGARAFCGCDQLESFSIGFAFKDHTGNFLANCHNLKSLTISGNTGHNTNGYVCEDNVLIHNVSNNNTSYFVACAPGKTGNYTLPTFSGYNRINILGECFEGCTGLTGITFPAGHTYWVGGRAFSGATNLRYIDMSSVDGIREGETTTAVTYNVDRQNTEDPFYGTSNATFIYLPDGHSAQADEPNVVIGGTANSILFTDGWDFCPPVNITATNGVGYDRVLKATRREITQKTGNKITVDGEEYDELVVTGYKFQRNGYSVCLPYGLTLSATNAKVYTPTAVATDKGTTTVTFTEVTNKVMTAYTPYYIIVDGDGDVSLDVDGPVTISRPAALPTTALTGFTFKGTMVTIANASLYDASQPTYILQSDGNWHRVPYDDDNVYAGPLRAYFQASADNGAAQLVTVFDETVSLADNADNTDILAQYNGSRVNAVQLAGRTLYKDGSWNTLCLPFDLTISGSPLAGDNVTAKVLDTASSSLDNGTLTLNFIDAPTTITAGTPFIIKWDNTGVNLVGDNFVFSGVTVKNTVNNASVEDVIDFVATYSPVSLDAGDNDKLYLGTGNTLYYPSTDMTINSCRAYFQLKGGFVAGSAAARIVLNFGDDEQTQGVTTPLSDRSEAAGEVLWYTLDGRRLSTKPAKKGIYLNNGHKVVVE